jgi:nitroimidazol reductase NimA-like FMN-containing flavoprotein (pyridoxamine 5'-phosphate oxidase superfamily)
MSETSDRPPDDLDAIARNIVDSNRFMTLATADDRGAPWATPVWYAPEEYREFFWVSKPGARHSENVAARPEVGIVIFDPHLVGGWNALYMTAVAEELGDVERGIGIFSRRSKEQGFPPWTGDQVLPPARHRLYRATVSEWFVLDTHDERHPVTP